MDFARQVPASIHREHVETLGLLERIEAALAKAKAAPAPGDAAWARLLRDLDANLANEIGRHFDFEENELFPLLASGGDRDIAALLAEEHEAILALAKRMIPALRAFTSGGSTQGWPALREMALELIERQVAHIQKEEMSLLPVLEDMLEPEQDAEMLNRYLATA
jgi:hemerythrin-like domain-containing protein